MDLSFENVRLSYFAVSTSRPTIVQASQDSGTDGPTVVFVRATIPTRNPIDLYIWVSVASFLVVVVVIVLIGCWCVRRHNVINKVKRSVYYENKADDGTVQFRSQALSTTSSSSYGSTAPLIGQRSFHSRLGSNLTQVSELEIPLDEDWEIDRGQINILDALGEGAFGKVMKAEGIGLPGMPHRCYVAVKMLKG